MGGCVWSEEQQALHHQDATDTPNSTSKRRRRKSSRRSHSPSRSSGAKSYTSASRPGMPGGSITGEEPSSPTLSLTHTNEEDFIKKNEFDGIVYSTSDGACHDDSLEKLQCGGNPLMKPSLTSTVVGPGESEEGISASATTQPPHDSEDPNDTADTIRFATSTAGARASLPSPPPPPLAECPEHTAPLMVEKQSPLCREESSAAAAASRGPPKVLTGEEDLRSSTSTVLSTPKDNIGRSCSQSSFKSTGADPGLFYHYTSTDSDTETPSVSVVLSPAVLSTSSSRAPTPVGSDGSVTSRDQLEKASRSRAGRLKRTIQEHSGGQYSGGSAGAMSSINNSITNDDGHFDQSSFNAINSPSPC